MDLVDNQFCFDYMLGAERYSIILISFEIQGRTPRYSVLNQEGIDLVKVSVDHKFPLDYI